MARELVVAARFGTAAELDALILAFAAISFAALLLGGAFGPAFVPEYVRALQRHDEPAADSLLRQATGWGLRGVGGATVLLAAALPFLSWLFPAIDAGLLTALAFTLLPLFPLIAVRQAASAVLNARNRYALPTAALTITPAVTIAVLLLQPDAWGVRGFAVAMVAGTLLEVLVIGRALRRVHPGWPARPELASSSSPAAESDPPIRRVARQYRHLIVGASLWATAPLVDSAMAAQLGAGAPSTLRFSINLTAAFLGLGAAALSIAVLPSFSRLVSESDDPASIRHALRGAVRLALLISLPVAIGLIVAAEPLTRLLYERGEFTATDTVAVSAAHVLCALQIPFYTVGVVLTRLLQALQRNALVSRVAVLNFVVNIGANLLLMRVLGVAGINLATSLVYLLACVLLGVAVWRSLPGEPQNRQQKPAIRTD